MNIPVVLRLMSMPLWLLFRSFRSFDFDLNRWWQDNARLVEYYCKIIRFDKFVIIKLETSLIYKQNKINRRVLFTYIELLLKKTLQFSRQMWIYRELKNKKLSYLVIPSCSVCNFLTLIVDCSPQLMTKFVITSITRTSLQRKAKPVHWISVIYRRVLCK